MLNHIDVYKTDRQIHNIQMSLVHMQNVIRLKLYLQGCIYTSISASNICLLATISALKQIRKYPKLSDNVSNLFAEININIISRYIYLGQVIVSFIYTDYQ